MKRPGPATDVVAGPGRLSFSDRETRQSCPRDITKRAGDLPAPPVGRIVNPYLHLRTDCRSVLQGRSPGGDPIKVGTLGTLGTLPPFWQLPDGPIFGQLDEITRH